MKLATDFNPTSLSWVNKKDGRGTRCEEADITSFFADLFVDGFRLTVTVRKYPKNYIISRIWKEETDGGQSHFEVISKWKHSDFMKYGPQTIENAWRRIEAETHRLFNLEF